MASKRSLGSLFIDIEARTARLEADLARTRGLLQSLNSNVRTISGGFAAAFGLAAKAVAAFAGIAALRGLKHMSMSTLEAVRSTMALAEATSLSVNDIKAYEEASEHLGVTNLSLAKTMKELFALQTDVRSGNKAAAAQIRQMGMSVDEFATLRPAELFESVIGKLNSISNVSLRAALSQKIFGKEAVNLSALLSQGTGAIASARKEMERLGQTISKFDEARVHTALTAVAELGDRWEAFKKNMSIGLTPLIFAASKRLADFIGSIKVEELAQKIVSWVNAITSFVLTIPQRLKVLMAEVKLIWHEFVASVLDVDPTGFLEKFFGTKQERQTKIKEVVAQITELKASINSVTVEMTEAFQEQIDKFLDTIAKAPAMSVEASKVMSSGMIELAQTFAGTFQQIADLSSNFIDGESLKFGDFFRSLVKTMISTFLKVSLINPLLNSVFGGMMGGTAGGWWTALPSLFGGGKARGGNMDAGKSYLVGERGPEIVSFGRPAYATPNDQLDSGQGQPLVINVTQHFQTGMTRTEFASAIPTIIHQTKTAVADAVLRGGNYTRAVRG